MHEYNYHSSHNSRDSNPDIEEEEEGSCTPRELDVTSPSQPSDPDVAPAREDPCHFSHEGEHHSVDLDRHREEPNTHLTYDCHHHEMQEEEDKSSHRSRHEEDKTVAFGKCNKEEEEGRCKPVEEEEGTK